MMHSHGMESILATCAGITEIDVRDWYPHPECDIYVIRAWNHLRYNVLGIEAYKEFSRRRNDGYR